MDGGGDVIANFLAITNVSDEEKAINYLSACDFNLGEAVQLFYASEGSNGGGGGGGRGGSTAMAENSPPVIPQDLIDDADGDVPTTRSQPARLFDANTNNRGRGQQGGGFDDDLPMLPHINGGGGANFETFLQERFGNDNNRAAGRRQQRGGRVAPPQHRQVSYSINTNARYPEPFIARHFGSVRQFRLPDAGCDARYTRRGGPPPDGFTPHNPVIDAFDNCCAVAASQRKFVLLVILEGDNAFPSVAFSRDILGNPTIGANFIEANLMPFYQVRLLNAALMVDTSFGSSHEELIAAVRREAGRVAAEDVRRMIYLNGLMTRYNLSGNQVPNDDTPSNKHRHLSTAAYPIVALINPVTKAIVHRIQLSTIVARRNDSDFSFDVDAFMTEVLPVLDTAERSLVKTDTDDFFLPGAHASAVAVSSPTAGKAEAIEVGSDEDQVETISRTTRPTATASVEAEREENVAERSQQVEETTTQPSTTTIAASTSSVSVMGKVAIGQDVSVLTPTNGAAVMKLRLRMPTGMFHVVCLDDIPLSEFLLFVAWNSAPNSVLKAGGGDSSSGNLADAGGGSTTDLGSQSAGSLTSPISSGPPTLALQADIPPTVNEYVENTLQCLGGFPPRPLSVPEGTFTTATTAVVTLKDWKGIRSGDMLTVASK